MRTTKHLLTILMALSFVSVKAQEGAIIHIDFIPDTCHTFTGPLGQLVAAKQGNGTESLTVDVSGLPSGLYFVAAIGEDGSRSVQKVVKE